MNLQATPFSMNMPSQALPSPKQQQPQQPHLQYRHLPAPKGLQQQQQQPTSGMPQQPANQRQQQQSTQNQAQTQPTLALASLGDGLFGGRSALAAPRVVAVAATVPSRLRAPSVSGIPEAAARASTPGGGAPRNRAPTADGMSYVAAASTTVATAADGDAAASPSGPWARSVGASPLRGMVLSVDLLPAAPPSASAASSLSEMLAATGSPTLARFATNSRFGRGSSPGMRVTANGGGGAAGVTLGQLTPLVVTAPPPQDTPLPATPHTPIGAPGTNGGFCNGDTFDLMPGGPGSPAAGSGGRDGALPAAPPSPSVLSLYAGRQVGGRSTWSNYGGMPSAWPGTPHVPPWLDFEVRGTAGPMAAEQALGSMAAAAATAAAAAGGADGCGGSGSKGRQVSGVHEGAVCSCLDAMPARRLAEADSLVLPGAFRTFAMAQSLLLAQGAHHPSL